MPFNLEDFWLEVARQMALAFKAKKINHRVNNSPVIPCGENIKRLSIVLNTLNSTPFINGIIHNGSKDKGREFFYLACPDNNEDVCFSRCSASHGISFRIKSQQDIKVLECAYRNYNP